MVEALFLCVDLEKIRIIPCGSLKIRFAAVVVAAVTVRAVSLSSDGESSEESSDNGIF